MAEDLSEQIYRMQARVCGALSDPKRLRIIHALCDRELTVGDLARNLGLRQANLSQHLMVMRERGIVTTRRQGVNIYYALASPKIVQACQIMREVLAEQLARSAQLSEDLRLTARSEPQA